MNFFKRKAFLIPAVVILLIVLIFVLISFFKNGNYETVTAEREDLVKIVEISGEVVPAEEVNMSFSASGNVIEILKDTGDKVSAGEVLARIDASQVSSEISEAQANLESAQARLQEIESGDNSEIQIKKSALVKTLKKSFVNADGIVRNQIDSFIVNPNGRYPEFNNSFNDFGPNQQLGEKRYEVGVILSEWKNYSNNLNENNFEYSDVTLFVNNLNKIEDLLSFIAGYSNEFEPSSTITQSQIDSYISNISSGRNTIASLLVEINSSLDNLRDIEAEVPIQNASVRNSSATVDRLYSKADDYVLRAPFDGIVTENNLELGQFVSSSDSAFVLISDSPLEIEVFIPEINIVGVDVNDTAKLKFDALPDLKIDAIVTHIDPKETLKDGVVTYRTLINLLTPNTDLRPGMSVDAEIEKEIVSNQLVIPSYTIIKENDESFVKVKSGSEIQKVKIEILDRDNRGKISVSGDLISGNEIIIPKDN